MNDFTDYESIVIENAYEDLIIEQCDGYSFEEALEYVVDVHDLDEDMTKELLKMFTTPKGEDQ